MGNELKVKFSDVSSKFLDSITEKDKNRIKEKIKFIANYISEYNLLLIKGVDIKRLSGSWEGYLRLRVGKIRVIFKYERNENELLIIGIDFRGNVYKK